MTIETKTLKSKSRRETRLMRLVREGIERLGDPMITVPPGSAYGFSDRVPYFELDIDFGGDFVLACSSLWGTNAKPTGSHIDALASAILDWIIAASRARTMLSDRIRQAVELGERAIQSSRTGMVLLDVRVEPLLLEDEQFPWAEFRLRARIQILGDSLQPETIEFNRLNPRDISREIRWHVTQQRACEASLRRLGRIGADFEIDAMVLAAMSLMKLDPAQVFYHLASYAFVFEAPSVRLPNGTETSSFFAMSRGRLVGCFALSDEVAVSWNSLTIAASLPANVMMHLKDRLVREVVDHPFLTGARIAGVEQNGDRTTLKLKIPKFPVWLDQDGKGFRLSPVPPETSDPARVAKRRSRRSLTRGAAADAT